MSQPMKSAHEATCGSPNSASLGEPGLSQRTEAFRLFELPRELRDKIFYYHLYRPRGVYYTAHANKEFWYDRKTGDDILNLLTVSKQVYTEAFKVFCSTNTVALSTEYNPREGYKKQLTGLLRLFPDRAAANLTRVSNIYRDVVVRPMGHWGYAPSHGPTADGGDGNGRYQKYNLAGETFIEILRDAHTVTQFFPKLIAFEVQWYPEPPFYENSERLGEVRRIARLLKNGTGEQEAVAMWLEVMRGWLQGQNVVPLGCAEFSLEGFAADGFGQELDILMNKAYRALVKEQMTGDDIEDSGRMWLEEMGREQTIRKKGKKKLAERA